MTERGRIISWDRSKGYGYVEHGERRLFLHVRDFAERHKMPEIGDVVVFSVGTDRKGRTCAVKAVHANDGGRLRSVHFAIVLALLVAPAIAGARLVERNQFCFLAGWVVAASGLTYFLYADDKHRARQGAWRAPEYALHLFEVIGGWPGAFLAQRKLRHKCSKLGYQFVFWSIVAVYQFVAVDSLLDWRMSRAAVDKMKELPKHARGP